MTKQYIQYLKRLKKQVDSQQEEVDSLKEELKGFIVLDTVSGSSVDSPYTPHPVKVEGISDSVGYGRKKIELFAAEERLGKSQTELDNFKSFVDGIEDEQLKTIFQMYFFRGKSNLEIAMNMGWQDESTPRRKIKKYLDNPENPDFKTVKLK